MPTKLKPTTKKQSTKTPKPKSIGKKQNCKIKKKELIQNQNKSTKKKTTKNPKKKNKKAIITKDTFIAEIVDLFPQAADLLYDKYEIYCIGCIMAEFETLEEGAMRHGITGAELIDMIDELNQSIS